jgi:4'-phosphopantetheinyl transferase
MSAAAPRRVPLTSFGAELWLVDLSVARGDQALACLSELERARAARFVFAADRRRYVAAHFALRELLGARLAIPAQKIEFELGEHGKPALARRFGCVFNMSHSGELALVGIGCDFPAGVELGVDLETLRPISDAAALAQAHFTTRERAELARVAPGELDRTFLAGWTRKEACLKAVGSGLSIAPSTFECGLAALRSATRIPTPRGVATIEVESVDVDRDHMAAVAITRPAIPSSQPETH